MPLLSKLGTYKKVFGLGVGVQGSEGNSSALVYCSAKGSGRGVHGVGLMSASKLQGHLCCKIMGLEFKVRDLI